MSTSIEEAWQKRDAALKAEAESGVLVQWYYALAITLTEQAYKGLVEPDFSQHWLAAGDAVTRYLRRIGHEWTLETWHEPVKAFLEELLGDQLEIYGLVLQVQPARGDGGAPNRFFLARRHG